MKAKQCVVRLTMGCVFALGLALNPESQAQEFQQGTFYSAKDPDLPPWPFNLYPELESVEIEPGIFLVDDTMVPDTPEQLAARAARLVAEEEAALLDPATAQLLAEEAARLRQAHYEDVVAPFIHQGIRTADGQPTTLRDTVRLRREQARAELPERQRAALAERQAFEEEVIQDGGQLELDLDDGRKARLVPSTGGPVYLIGHSINAADTISTDEVLQGGSSGFNLTGDSQLMGIWDGTAVRSSHWEFGENVPVSPSSLHFSPIEPETCFHGE